MTLGPQGLLIYETLMDALQPSSLEVVDESPAHYGHREAPGEKSHFRIRIAADSLKSLSRVAQHRRIYEVLKMDSGVVHALAIEIL